MIFHYILVPILINVTETKINMKIYQQYYHQMNIKLPSRQTRNVADENIDILQIHYE
jgi:hypothetical protein